MGCRRFSVVLLSCVACGGGSPATTASADALSEPSGATPVGETTLSQGDGAAAFHSADVIGVTATQATDGYTFSVTIRSPDTGCEQYANWWEVLDAQGQLIYRRILGHSHVSEQPFERSGGPVQIDADSTVFIRAHMDPDGYGGAAWMGSVQTGFRAAEPKSFTAEPGVESAAPQPDGCAF